MCLFLCSGPNTIIKLGETGSSELHTCKCKISCLLLAARLKPSHRFYRLTKIIEGFKAVWVITQVPVEDQSLIIILNYYKCVRKINSNKWAGVNLRKVTFNGIGPGKYTGMTFNKPRPVVTQGLFGL